MRDAQGVIIGYLLIGTDNTARKRVEAEKEKLENENRQLQKSESLGRMASAIAHHFNNQLQGVMLNLELALSNVSTEDPSFVCLSAARASAQKAAEVSTQMLVYMGLTHGERTVLDISQVCLQSLSMLRAVLPSPCILEADLPAMGIVANANANQIQQVLINLVTNAGEAARASSGPIRLSLKTVPAEAIAPTGRFPVEFAPQGVAYVCLEVTDNGSGITPQDTEKLFEPFFSSKFIGRGLGLSVVLGIARAHGGVVTVESTPGLGSVFRVFLPVADAPLPPPPSPVEVPPVAPGGTILVVEDERLVLEVYRTLLVSLGFTVVTARDGVEALELFSQHQSQIRLVVSDIKMPRMDGWETLLAMRKLSPGLPVILCSGYSEAQAMEDVHTELPQAFLSKPFSFDALRTAVFKVLAAGAISAA